ncbi:hypothetical protein PPL_06534 [Heterostelium album PN500]|uniref:Uncharacterized protein n=1 Tax=Heterostelium pallidum (strain ATCC 26659 / Pp 5 / PN500) TaxID=670386 RepID=D3BDF1_HETP5|nr:hypothetical protein PPL_06534 [Heterostelium album PN500]EFA80595.1 hypothetical protein PPL_06534 [Heterostelium album PN500]|eukprot:XP_020432715.1 hypothetical protein PPL_06534 [Heterostelium album PN500]
MNTLIIFGSVAYNPPSEITTVKEVQDTVEGFQHSWKESPSCMESSLAMH